MRLGNYDALWFMFALVAILLPAYLWNFRRKARVLKALANVEILRSINSTVSVPRQILKAVVLLAAFVFIVIAFSRPMWNPKPREVKRKGRDVVILLDVSRSMLANDIKPNRLERCCYC